MREFKSKIVSRLPRFSLQNHRIYRKWMPKKCEKRRDDGRCRLMGFDFPNKVELEPKKKFV